MHKTVLNSPIHFKIHLLHFAKSSLIAKDITFSTNEPFLVTRFNNNYYLFSFVLSMCIYGKLLPTNSRNFFVLKMLHGTIDYVSKNKYY